MKKKAEKKIDLIICKLQDLYYMGCSDSVLSKLEEVLSRARELQSKIEDSNTWKKP